MGEVFCCFGRYEFVAECGFAPIGFYGNMRNGTRFVPLLFVGGCLTHRLFSNYHMFLTNYDNRSIIKKPRGNPRTWEHRARDFFGSPVKDARLVRFFETDKPMAVTSSRHRRNQIFLFFLRKSFRREVVSMYVTWDQMLLLGGFILSLVKLLHDIYNKKK